MTTPTAPPASYPGTIKTFTTKEDGEVIYGAHANEWQNEIVGIQQAVGRNPQVPSVTLPTNPPTPNSASDRIANIETSAVWTAGNQVIGGNKEFSQLLVVDSGLQIKGGTYEHRTSNYRVIGDSTGYQAKTADGVSNADFTFQPSGGILRRAGYKVWDEGNDGPGSGLDADTLDGHQASEFLLRQGVVLRTSSSLTVPQNAANQFPNNYWRTVPFNTVYYEYRQNDGQRLFDPVNKYLLAPDTGMWLLNITLCFSGPGGGWRGLRAVDPANAVNDWAENFIYYAWDRKDFSDLKQYAGIGASLGFPQEGGVYQIMFESTRTQYITAGTKLRIDAWSDGPNTTSIVPGGSGHNHLTTEVSWMQIG